MITLAPSFLLPSTMANEEETRKKRDKQRDAVMQHPVLRPTNETNHSVTHGHGAPSPSLSISLRANLGTDCAEGAHIHIFFSLLSRI